MPSIKRNFRKSCVRVANGRNADRLRDLLDSDAEAGDQVVPRANAKLGTGQGAFGADIGQHSFLAQCRFHNSNAFIQLLICVGKQVERQVAVTAIVELEQPDVGNVI